MSEAIKKALRKWDRLYQGLSFLRCWSVSGRKEALRRYREHWEEKRIREELYRKNTLTDAERARQEREAFPEGIAFSVLVPLYNTPAGFLRSQFFTPQGVRWFLIAGAFYGAGILMNTLFTKEKLDV